MCEGSRSVFHYRFMQLCGMIMCQESDTHDTAKRCPSLTGTAICIRHGFATTTTTTTTNPLGGPSIILVTVSGARSSTAPYATSKATCASGYHRVGCSCHSEYGSCDGIDAGLDDSQSCTAYNEAQGGLGVSGREQAGLFGPVSDRFPTGFRP